MRILKHKSFRRLMIGKVISLLGSNMMQFALSLYVLTQTGSATLFASVIAISILPRLLLSPIAGVCGDWFDRKKSIVGFDILNGLILLIYGAVFIFYGEISILGIYLLVIALETTEIFFGAAMAAVVPSMLEKDQLLDANRIKSMITQIAVILAPIIGSFVYTLVGIGILFIVDGISFIISAFFESMIDIPKTNKKPEKVNVKSFVKDFVEGVKLLRTHKFLRVIIGFGVFLNFSLTPLFSVGLIYVILNVLEATELQYGMMIAVISFSSLVGPIILSKVMKQKTVGRLVIETFSMITIVIFLMAALVYPPVFSLLNNGYIPMIIMSVLLFFVGLLSSVTNIAIGTLFDQLVPLEFMGRTASTMNLGMMLVIPLGQMIFGVGLDRLPIYTMIGIVGTMVGLTLLFFKKSFKLADAQREEEKESA
jgi:MFS family permease